MFVISVPWSSAFHRAFALVAFVALGAVILTGRFDFADFYEGMPTYFGIVAVLLVLSISGLSDPGCPLRGPDPGPDGGADPPGSKHQGDGSGSSGMSSVPFSMWEHSSL